MRVNAAFVSGFQRVDQFTHLYVHVSLRIVLYASLRIFTHCPLRAFNCLYLSLRINCPLRVFTYLHALSFTRL